MQVKDIMTANPAFCTKDTSLTDVARLMVENDCGGLPVMESMNSKRLVGIITDRDIVTRTLADGKDPFEMAAGDCMTPNVVSVSADAGVEECADLMKRHQVRRIVVRDADGRCCGIVAQADLAEHAPKDKTGETVREVSQPTGTA